MFIWFQMKDSGLIFSYNVWARISNVSRNTMGMRGICQVWILFILISKAYEIASSCHTVVFCLLGLINPDVTLTTSLKLYEGDVWIIHKITNMALWKAVARILEEISFDWISEKYRTITTFRAVLVIAVGHILTDWGLLQLHICLDQRTKVVWRLQQ